MQKNKTSSYDVSYRGSQFAWAEIIATGKGKFVDYPTAIGTATITFNDNGVVYIKDIQRLRFMRGPLKKKKFHHPSHSDLIKWPLMSPQITANGSERTQSHIFSRK